MSIANVIGKKIINAIDSVAEYNRTQAELTRLRLVIKSETGKLNRAYIALGKEYYNIIKQQADDKHEELVSAIVSAEQRINEVRERYNKIKNGTSVDESEESCCEKSVITVCEDESCSQTCETEELPDESKKTQRKSIRTIVKKAEQKAETSESEKQPEVEVTAIINDGDVLVDIVNTDGEVAEE